MGSCTSSTSCCAAATIRVSWLLLRMQLYLKKCAYVITLDSDTQLPRDAARKLFGTALHPLNRPRIDPSVNRVTYGYGIFQPRVSISLESAVASASPAPFPEHRVGPLHHCSV